MKTIFLLSAMLAAGVTAQAQDKDKPVMAKGTVLLGGSISYRRISIQVNNGSGMGPMLDERLALEPVVGYFLVNNLALGLEGRWSTETQNWRGTDPVTERRWGGFVQYYRMLASNFGLTATAAGGYSRQVLYLQRGPNPDEMVESTGYYLSLTPGIVFLPVPQLGLTATVGQLAFTHSKVPGLPTADAPEIITNDFSSTFGLRSLQLGATYYFGR